MSRRIVRRGDWSEALPLAAPRPIPAPRRVWTDAEMERIRAGLLPRQMEDKWFAFFEEGELHLHRSWTGDGIYRARFEAVEGGSVMKDVHVCGDLERYRRGADAEERSRLEGLVATKLARDEDDASPGPRSGRPSLIEVVQGDITLEETDAIVNAANSSLLGGGGVDGAIHAAAGPELLQACRLLGGCEPGQAKVTAGFGLRATWIVHTVGPIWGGGTEGEPEVLASCYRESMARAEEKGARTLSFPAISTGVYGYPGDLAAQVAVSTVLATPTRLERVRMVCFDPGTEGFLRDALARQ